ncbi:hypothetical protein CDD80_3617 [Ophiocordyceps camponoti-rufipedis]|uniref:Uncharacterized protein n=1 Tax=Ophiocordyceps camponoti-rufipedis TaxID=2004952 RepID=A0A2C5XIL3_9HYPO|nr:hypothetical protein CDD80_3617 [Ophiocordyceps camponoti-rufipedis]
MTRPMIQANDAWTLLSVKDGYLTAKPISQIESLIATTARDTSTANLSSPGILDSYPPPIIDVGPESAQNSNSSPEQRVTAAPARLNRRLSTPLSPMVA